MMNSRARSPGATETCLGGEDRVDERQRGRGPQGQVGDIDKSECLGKVEGLAEDGNGNGEMRNEGARATVVSGKEE